MEVALVKILKRREKRERDEKRGGGDPVCLSSGKRTRGLICHVKSLVCHLFVFVNRHAHNAVCVHVRFPRVCVLCLCSAFTYVCVCVLLWYNVNVWACVCDCFLSADFASGG